MLSGHHFDCTTTHTTHHEPVDGYQGCLAAERAERNPAMRLHEHIIVYRKIVFYMVQCIATCWGKLTSSPFHPQLESLWEQYTRISFKIHSSWRNCCGEGTVTERIWFVLSFDRLNISTAEVRAALSLIPRAWVQGYYSP